MTATVTRARPTAAERRVDVSAEFDQWRAVRRSLAGVTQTDFRPDVEGLRAVAVIAVLAFHVRLAGFGGGFVGVDVFFVLSGFLITRLLLREMATTGTLSLPAFWARRSRRLLPASCLVLVATAVASHWLLPPLAQGSLAVDTAAAAAFVVNFVFADRFGDYFGAQLGEVAPSPLLHFWSLAVEEQFYLVWPGLMLAATRRRWRDHRRALLTVVLILAGASFVLSAWLTDVRPTWAFYLLPARMGELLAGAAIAVVGSSFRLVSAQGRAAAGWLGIVGIAVAVVTYDGGTSFPGTATLLPVLSTVLVIVAGGAGCHPAGPVKVLGRPPLQWVGRHSYAIYLWHWPALVLAEVRFGPLPLVTRLAVVGGSIVLAALSVMLVEIPVRHSRWVAARARRGLMLGAALCSIGLLVAWTAGAASAPLRTATVAASPELIAALPASPAADAPTVAPGVAPAPTTYEGLLVANQLLLEQALAANDVPANLRPSLATAVGDKAQVYGDGCVAIGVDDEPTPCRYGDPASSTKVVLYGDSHAAQWSPPLIELAQQHGFQLVVVVKGGCPTAAVSHATATLGRTCPLWRDRSIELIAAEAPDLVMLTAWSGYPNSDAEWAAGLDATVARLAPLTSQLIVLGDNPPAREQPAACLSAHLRSARECTTTPEHVVATSRLAVEQAVAGSHGAAFLDTTPWLCAPTGCPVMIGDILLYRDRDHLSTTGSAFLRPLLEAALIPLL